LGECFLKIATHLSFKPNFVNYIFKDDMISDGIENCVMYIHNFDPEKSQNPFAYFTQIIHYAFLRRIQKEKKQLEIKNKILERTGFDEVFFDDNLIDGMNYSDYNSIKDNIHSKSRY
jgi:DNA-directed RNA polymerase specialized sigma subunit